MKEEYVLQKDIIIPAGTKFDNHTNEAKEGGYYECIVGVGNDCSEFFRIGAMDEILRHEPAFFSEDESSNTAHPIAALSESDQQIEERTDRNIELEQEGKSTYSEADLTSFGNYILSVEREAKVWGVPELLPAIETRLRSVSHADVSNWKEANEHNAWEEGHRGAAESLNDDGSGIDYDNPNSEEDDEIL